MRIGWFSNWFSLKYKRDSGVPKNIREIPILKELLRRNIEIAWLGTNPNADATAYFGVSNYGGFLRRVPRYDKSRWKSTAEYVRDVTVNFENYTDFKFPKVDAVFVRVLPSFIYENLKIYIMLYHFGLQNIPVFVRDLELVMIKKFIEGGDYKDAKPFAISGSDKAFTIEDWEIMSRNVIMVNPISKQGNEFLIQQCAAHLKFETFYFPYDETLYPTMEPGPPRRYVTYIGNDTGRRGGFSKYLKGLPRAFVHVYGGQARQIGKSELNFPKEFRAKFPDIIFHGVVPHVEVNRIYNASAVCMNIPKPVFNKVGFVSARFLEAVFSGAVLCLPKEFLLSEKWTGYPHFCVIDNVDQLEDVARTVAMDYQTRKEILEVQREVLRAESDIKRNLDRLLEYV